VERNVTTPSETLLAAVASQTDNPHYAAVGGSEALARLAERFYHYMDTLPCAERVRAMHPPDLAGPKAILTRYLIEWTGGPALYSSERGRPRLGQRHRIFKIQQEDLDAWMVCMRSALEEVVADTQVRAELQAAFERIGYALTHPHEKHHHQQLVQLSPDFQSHVKTQPPRLGS